MAKASETMTAMRAWLGHDALVILAAALRSVDKVAREECARLVDSALLDFPPPRGDYAEGYSTARRAALKAIKP